MNLIHFNKMLFAVILLATLYSCRKDFSVKEKIDPASEVKNDLTKTKLGKEKGNPFSFEVVKKAIEKVKKQKTEARRQAQAASPNLMLAPVSCEGLG